jgi:anti-anti-sigma factor
VFDLRECRAACRLSGEVDLAVARSAGRDLLGAARSAPGPSVEVDCSELTFIDAAGITMLFRVATESGKAVRLINVTPTCRRVFDVLDLCEQFGIDSPTARRVREGLAIPA